MTSERNEGLVDDPAARALEELVIELDRCVGEITEA
jgi:hypothetical protein